MTVNTSCDLQEAQHLKRGKDRHVQHSRRSTGLAQAKIRPSTHYPAWRLNEARTNKKPRQLQLPGLKLRLAAED